MEYVHVLRRLRLLVRRHGLDVLMTTGTLFELAVKRSQAVQVTLSFAVPATVIMVLPLLMRRQLQFAAPAASDCLPLGCRSSTGA